MANVKISELTAATTVAASDQFEVNAGGTSKSATAQKVADFVASVSKTLTNTTFDTAGSGNSFKINGTAISAVTGTGSAVLAASPTLSGTIGGNLTFGGTITMSSALTYGGITLSNAVTGTGSMVLSNQPTFNAGSITGSVVMGQFASTATGSATLSVTNSSTDNAAVSRLFTELGGVVNGFVSWGVQYNSGTPFAYVGLGAGITGGLELGAAVTITGALKYGGVTLSNSVTGTGSMVLSASPTLTGTLTAATVTASGILTGLSATAVGSGAATQAWVKASSTADLGIYYGTGAPGFSAAKGSLYSRTDATTTTTRLYVNTNGSTTWANFTASA